MNPELKKKLIEDLRKTGFGSELRAISTLKKLKWDVEASAGYFDKDENKTREIDAIAQRQEWHSRGEKHFIVTCYLAIEVKKSDKPWIVFRHEKDSKGILLLGSDGLNWDGSIITISASPVTEKQRLNELLTLML